MSKKLEWRVEWKFQGEDKRMKSKVFQNEKVARSRYKFLLDIDPDAYVCCSGWECGCGGRTNGEEWGHLQYAGIRCREVGPWEQPE